MLLAPLLWFGLYAHTPASPAVPISLTVRSDQGPLAHFIPDESLGGCVDGLDEGDIAKAYTPANVKAMRSSGFGSLAYRLRTELAVEAWHWNPSGRWSEPKNKAGYWTSADTPTAPILQCNGYRLPRRGDTHDQANDDGYSRLDDGDPTTFWKSNPYLSPPYAPEDHPQWIVVELPEETPVDTVRIEWANPYATRFVVEYWDGEPDSTGIDSSLYDPGGWRAFPKGTVDSGSGGTATIRLCDRPIPIALVRIRLLASSGTAEPGRTDPRDRLGYAVREIGVGTTDSSGRFHDAVRHGRSSASQSVTHVSSTDPWNAAKDLDPNVEQPGFDRVFRSGVTGGLPVMIPVGIVYDTPENAVAEIRYLKTRGYPVSRVELGEEPDGQYMDPEDYGALYLEWAHTLHQAFPDLKLGGPSYQTMQIDEVAWPDASGDRSWTRRFLNYLKSHAALGELQFFTSEYYPFDDIDRPTMPHVLKIPDLVRSASARWHAEGLPPSIPIYASEYGYSPYSCEPEVDMAGAIADADIAASVLANGGAGTYFYGLEPNSIIADRGSTSYGNLALFHSDDDRVIEAPFPAYWAMRMVTQEWSQPGNGQVDLYPVDCDAPRVGGKAVVDAYAVRRPDGQWSVLILNKDEHAAHSVQISFAAGASWAGPTDVVQYSGREYRWHPNGEMGYAKPDRAPERWKSRGSTVGLPPYSLTVVRGGLTTAP